MLKAFKLIEKVENFIVGILIFLTTMLLFANVVMRRFGTSTTWAEEAIRYAMIWITFLGCSACVRSHLHVGIDVVVASAKQSVKKVLIFTSELLSALFCFIAGFYGISNTQMVFEMNQKSSAMMMPMWIVYIAIPIGLILSGVNFLINSYLTIADKNIKEEDILDLSKHS